MPLVISGPDGWMPADMVANGVWCVGRVTPLDAVPDDFAAEWEMPHKHATKQQCVKLGGEWWQWDKDAKRLIPFEGSSAFLVHKESKRRGIWMNEKVSVDKPDEVFPIPDGVLNAGIVSHIVTA